MRYFKSADGKSVNGIMDGESATIEALLADGWMEVTSMHPGATEIVWKRPDDTISVTTVTPEILAQMELAHGLLALDKQAAADAVIAAETALAGAVAALEAADRVVSGWAQASKLRVAVKDHIAGIAQQMEVSLAEVNREAMSAIGQIDARDAELIALENSGVQAQAEIARLQGLLRDAEAAQLAAVQAGEQASALVASPDITPEGRQQHLDALTRAHHDESLAASLITEISATIGRMTQLADQAKAATSERQQLQTLRRDRRTQDETTAAALRIGTSHAIAELEARDKELAAMEFAAARAEQQLARLADAHAQKKAELAAARKLVEDIAVAEQTSATIGNTLEEHIQRLKASGAVPADWTVAAIYRDVTWRPEWPVQDDMVWDDAARAVVVDIARARETTRQRLRIERTPVLATLDIQSMRNMEAGADNSAVVAEKARLRDITQQPDACQTIDELKALKC